MLQKPASSGLPTHAAPVYEISGHPHPLVVVQITSFSQLAAETVDANQTSRALDDILWQSFAVIFSSVTSFVGFLVLPNPVAQFGVQSLPIIPPTQLVDEFYCLFWMSHLLQYGIPDFRKTQNSVAQIGRQARYRTVEEIAG